MLQFKRQGIRVIIRTNFLTEEEHQRVLDAVKNKLQTTENQINEGSFKPSALPSAIN